MRRRNTFFCSKLDNNSVLTNIHGPLSISSQQWAFSSVPTSDVLNKAEKHSASNDAVIYDDFATPIRRPGPRPPVPALGSVSRVRRTIESLAAVERTA